MFKLKTNLEDIKLKLWKSKGLVFIASIALFLLSASIFRVQGTQANKDKEVLGETSKVVLNTPSPILTKTPLTVPTSIPIPTRSLVPTAIPTAISTPTPTSTTTNNTNSPASNTPTPTSSPTQAPTPTVTSAPTPSPTPAGLNIQIGVDYAGQKSSDSYNIILNPDQTAWDAVVAAIGVDNIKYTDYGGDMGKFITSFNGIDAGGNQYYEFRVNGSSSDVGVSSYKCNDNDKLDFVLTSF